MLAIDYKPVAQRKVVATGGQNFAAWQAGCRERASF